ncbi:MAG: rubrerythrin family protein [Bacteroidetes bacterium]|nr:MAG: rubrerythrin family protein [Bacteroidota bacterium]
MNATTFSQRIQFHFFVLSPYAIVLLVIAFLFGCQQKKEQVKQEPQPTVTLENLQTAYNKAMRHNFMYSKFVPQAEKEKNKEMANLYRAIARSEEIHAQQHAALLRSKGIEPKEPIFDSITVGTIMQTLKMALSSEEIETESMYPNLMRTAEAEKFPQAAEQFTLCREGDIRQSDLMKEAQNTNGKIKKVPYLICPACGYIFTSEEVEGCPTCKIKKDKFEKI